MIKVGKYNRLKVLRAVNFGLYLGAEHEGDVLLPKKYVPEDTKLGQMITVFVYLDSEHRPVATTLHPKIQRNEFGVLQVKQVSRVGAFMDWGLEKDLLVPFREQEGRMIEGESYPVFLYMDTVSQRLVASGHVHKFLEKEHVRVSEGEEVDFLVTERTENGFRGILNNLHWGMIYHNEIFQEVKIGDRLKAWVKMVREDLKVDLSLQVPGIGAIEPNAQLILEKLEAEGGFLPLHDKSDPEKIKALLKMSKKAFKKAIGGLYKQRLIEIGPDGISKK